MPGAKTPLFQIEDLHVEAGGAEILKGVDLTIFPGEVHALMGPNGSGKSTLASALMGSSEYTVTGGRIRFQGDDITDWGPDVRGKAGVFLAFQYPQTIPGVSVINFLRQALSARKGIDLSVLELRLSIMEWMQRLEMDPSFADRYLNEGFSGGEKKRNEILQMAILEPELAILDETDSGLDIDALRVVAQGVREVRSIRTELGIEVRWIPVRADGHLDLTDLDRLVDGAKVVSFAAMSNVLGTMLPVEQLVTAAHDAGAIAVVDASQHVPHVATDVQAWGADFAAFTGHKMCGPTGIGVLWGTAEILEATPPFLTGGEMILNVTKEGFTTNELPWKFEAGTPPIAEAVGLGAAVDYLDGLGMEAVREHEVALTAYALRSLTGRFGDDLVIHGPSEPAERGGVMSFTFADIHPHDLTQVFDEQGVCVRAGHHCAKPLMRELGVAATARASLYVYNDEADVDALADAIGAAEAFFAP